MKTLLLASCLVLPAALWAADAPYTIVDRGEYFQTWARGTARTLPNGEKQLTTNYYTELGSCLNYQENGVWRPSQDLIELLPDGATARHAPHKAIFADDLHAPDALTLFDREGRKLQASLLGIAYSHPASGRSVLFGETRSCIGELVGDREIWYRDCLEGCRADVRITYSKVGVEHDVIFRAQPPDPARFNLPGEGVVMQVWSAFRGAPPARLIPGPGGTNQGVARIDFGGLFIGRGRAFALEDQPRRRGLPSSAGHGLEIQKSWVKLAGQNWLVESLPYSAALPHLLRLPKDPLLGAKDAPQPRPLLEALQAHASVVPATQPRATRRMTRALPPPSPAAPVQAAARAEGRPLPPQLSALGPEPSQGFVWDYVILNGTVYDQTLKRGTTYYISSDLFLEGLTTLEGGAILKHNNGAGLYIGGTVACQTGPYDPAIVTCLDDDSLGTVLPGSTGCPTNYYAAPAFYFLNQNSDLHDLRIAYAAQALWYADTSGMPPRLAHSQLLHCQTAVVADSAHFSLRNVLCYDIRTNFHHSAGGAPSGSCEQVTFDRIGRLSSATNESLCLTNCLLVGVTNYAGYTGANNASNTPAVFQKIGAGAHYLDYPAYRHAGTTNIHPVLLAELRQRTTYPPACPSGPIVTDTTLAPCVARNEGDPPVGYSYDAIDYAVTSLQVSDATLVLTNGVVVAAYGDTGLEVVTGGKLVSEGSPLQPNRLINCHVVQEGVEAWGETAASEWWMTVALPWTGFPRPSLRFRFTDFSALDASHLRGTSGQIATNLLFTDCHLRGGRIEMNNDEETTNSTTYIGLTNNVLERTAVAFSIHGPAWPLGWIGVRNNLFRGGSITYDYYDPAAGWQVHDNLFEEVTFANQHAYVSHSHNAYVNTTPMWSSLGGDLTPGAIGYEMGPLSRFYLPTNSPLIGAGSVNDAAQLGYFHCTSTVNQQKAFHSPLNIGPYYVALDRSGETSTVWLNDDPGANWANWVSETGGSPWSWATAPVYSGANAHEAPFQSIVHEHYFYGAATELALQPGDRLFTYLYLGPNPLASAVMLQWGSTDNSWDHRAFWGPDNIEYWPRAHVGPRPYPGGWVRLEVPVEQVDLDGRTLHGMGFTLCGGSALWDYSGKISPGPLKLFDGDGDGLPDYLEDRNGNGAYDSGAGESDWQQPTDPALQVRILRPRDGDLVP